MNISKQDLAYTAGIVDGEGYIGIIKTHYIHRNEWEAIARYQLVVNVGISNKELCQWLQMRFGGGVFSRKAYSNKPIWDWRVGSGSARDFLKLLRPYIKVKKLQLENGLYFVEKKDSFRGRGRISDQELAFRETRYEVGRELNGTIT